MKLALIDQSFHWPPTGGSWLDLRETAIRLVNHGFSLKIFVPEWNRWNIPGGRISADPGIPVEVIPIRSKQWNFYQLPRILKGRVDLWHPDAVMIGNTFYMAPFIIRQFKNLPVYLRIYAHELICLNYTSLCKSNVFKWQKNNPFGKVCKGNLLETPFQCWFCGMRRFAGTLIGPRLNPVAVEYWTSLAFYPFYKRIVQETLNSLNGIMVYNPFIQSILSPLNCPVHVVPAGIDCHRFFPQEKKETRITRILLTGRLDDQRKGYHSFQKCVRILRERGLEVEALVTDSQHVGSDDLVKSLGWISWDKLPDVYRSVDIAVVPSIWSEPFGITALEAMASGLPVVASRIGGFRYSVQDGVTGLHFSPGDPIDMADKIEILIKDPDLRMRMGAAGRQRVLDFFQWDSIIRRYTAPILRGETPEPSNWLDQVGNCCTPAAFTGTRIVKAGNRIVSR